MSTTIEQFIETVSDVLDDTEPETLTAETALVDIEEWGSLTALSLVAVVKMKYQKTLSGDGIASCLTLGDLYRLIEPE